MSIFLEEEVRRSPTGKQPALGVPEIIGVLPFSGHRNPLTRSSVARRVSTTFATRATNGIPKLYHFEALTEWAATLDTLLDPTVYGIDVQLPPIRYPWPGRKKLREHYFDLRITFDDGFRRAIFVRNSWSLTKPKTQAEIDAIFNEITTDFADDAIVVDGDQYTRQYRDNLFRVFQACLATDSEADEVIAQAAYSTNYWFLKDLVRNSGLPAPRAFQAALRMIGRSVLAADWYSVIWMHSRVWLAE